MTVNLQTTVTGHRHVSEPIRHSLSVSRAHDSVTDTKTQLLHMATSKYTSTVERALATACAGRHSMSEGF